MNSDLKSLPLKATVSQISLLLKETQHNGFPILTQEGFLKGFITRHTLIVLMRELDRIPDLDRTNATSDNEEKELTW